MSRIAEKRNAFLGAFMGSGGRNLKEIDRFEDPGVDRMGGCGLD